MRRLSKVTLWLALLVFVGGAGLLAGCNSPVAQESPEAQRQRAEAERIRAETEQVKAEALAYQQQTQADTQAAGERASIRQIERDAAYQRTLGLLPYVLTILGGLLLAGLGGLIFWDLRRQSSQNEPGIAHLEYLLLQQAKDSRDLWRAIAKTQRLSLPASSQGREVVIYNLEEGGKQDGQEYL